ncbi:hypothetical protein NJB1907f44_07420 [Mycobacterium marinum]|uniref:Uncharacterized protein n=1 Tax=Mycobacterium shottsii TaxID=133549 RepID=A0A7I7L6X0_9MYCO|nr:hypothetical protein MSHO_05870 [Mycobacterium shottsii]GJO03290.1 hypothetical protein NJB1907f34b_23180 [Mycobacterium marinum]GJO08634.1 hypothetical protein NJB1907E90_23810 [Mycobacterium marinum]GJO08968.1 hypothetical protein NJB1808e29_42330 [Mycobacterium marinum]GJO13881.1 hypothetical protein NJB1907E11_10070 [Mycobacterium marinum]
MFTDEQSNRFSAAHDHEHARPDPKSSDAGVSTPDGGAPPCVGAYATGAAPCVVEPIREVIYAKSGSVSYLGERRGKAE